MKERKPICPKCFKPKGNVEGAWICFTHYTESGINSMSNSERWLEFGPLLGNVLALILDWDVWNTYSTEVVRGMLLKAAGDTRWEWP